MLKYSNNILKGSRSEVMAVIKQTIMNKDRKSLVTANSEILVNALDNTELQDFLVNEDTIIVVDGIAALKSFNYLGLNNITKIPGIEIVQELLSFADENQLKIAVLGGTPKSNENFSRFVKNNHTNINLVGAVDGFINNKPAAMEKFALDQPDIILVALGVPRQEVLISETYKYFDHGLFIGCGGSLDVIGKTKKRAPKIFRVTSTEWLYRIILEPNRIKRFFSTNLKFLKVTLKSKKS